MYKEVIEGRYTEIECDWTGFTQAVSSVKDKGEEHWFERTKNKDEDLTQYKWIRCEDCDRDYHIPSALSQLTHSSLESYYRDNGFYHWYCGECRGEGRFALRRSIYGTASYMNGIDIHPLTHYASNKEAGNEALAFKMREYINMIGEEYHHTKTLSLDACKFDEKKGWCYSTEWNGKRPVNSLVDGLGEFVGYMKTFQVQMKDFDYHDVEDHDIIIHDFRLGSDGIGGFNTRMLVQYKSIYYLCGMEAEGSDDRWWNRDYLSGEQFFIDVLRTWYMRLIQ